MPKKYKNSQFAGFGKRLALLIKEHETRPAWVAKATGVDRAIINRILREEVEISFTVFLLSDHFGVHVDWLARGKGEKYLES